MRRPPARAGQISGNWTRTGPLLLEFPAVPTHPSAKGGKRSPIPRAPKGQTPVSAWNLLRCHRVFEREKGTKPVLALHHLVTAGSVKNRLMGPLTFAAGNARHLHSSG